MTTNGTLCLILLACFLVGGTAAEAATPQVYNTPHHQSPVRADPGDLLLIPGFGFEEGAVAVYRRVVSTSVLPPPPFFLPLVNTPMVGRLDLVDLPAPTPDAYNNVPDSLAARLPMVMTKGRTYVLWVRNPGSAWSEPILINDARPQWLTPDLVYETSTVASLPRELKVVGRNLEPAPMRTTLVRLTGPATYTLPAAVTGPGAPIDHYVARVQLPTPMRPGVYAAALTRDGINWNAVTANALTVLPDPQPKPIFDVTNHGGCLPDDGLPDEVCIVAAIDAAAAAGGGAVFFPPGRWDLVDPNNVPQALSYGIVVPRGVDFLGATVAPSVLVKGPIWSLHTVFSLLGDHHIGGIHFTETLAAAATAPTQTVFFRLGRPFAPSDPPVEHVVFTGNRFTEIWYAIATDRPTRRLFVVGNEMQAYDNDVFLTGNPYLKEVRAYARDSVIAYNTFLPGDYTDPVGAGTIATAVGTAQRLDLSHNVADGTVNGGWRATHFFHLSNSNEMLLVSQNHDTCTGDKAGDGEAIVYDNNQNVMGFSSVRTVQTASPTTVSVAGPWLETTPDFYDEHWVIVADGPGVGQARKIVSYTTDPSPLITVAPAWDVVPVAGSSSIVVGRTFWSTYIVDNVVDIRPPCLKSNPLKPQAGLVGWAGMTIDSTIEGNRLYDTNGVYVSTGYLSQDSPLLGWLGTSAWLNYANEVRGNLIDGEYAFPSSIGGVSLAYGGVPDLVSPLLGYGLSISHNSVIASDAGRHGDQPHGGVGAYYTWYTSTLTPYTFKALLIFRNVFADMGTGIRFEAPSSPEAANVHNAVLNANTFVNVSTPIEDHGVRTALLP
jgi:hypothetical protein